MYPEIEGRPLILNNGEYKQKKLLSTRSRSSCYTNNNNRNTISFRQQMSMATCEVQFLDGHMFPLVTESRASSSFECSI